MNVRWLPVEQLTDGVMCAAAARRASVRLRSGTIVQLVRWRGRQIGRQARCENYTGGRFTVRCDDVVELGVEL